MGNGIMHCQQPSRDTEANLKTLPVQRNSSVDHNLGKINKSDQSEKAALKNSGTTKFARMFQPSMLSSRLGQYEEEISR